MTNCGSGVMWRTRLLAPVSEACLRGAAEQRGREIEQKGEVGQNRRRGNEAHLCPCGLQF